MNSAFLDAIRAAYALAQSPNFTRLRSLDLSWCHVGAWGAKTLAGSANLPALVSVGLMRAERPMTPAGAAALQARFGRGAAFIAASEDGS
jgi:hypothetical protein